MLTANGTADMSLAYPNGISSTLANKKPGSIAVWIFIYAELTEFAFFFLAFLFAKLYFPAEFHQGPPQLSTLTGLLNTLVLLSSSFFVVRAIKQIKQGNKNRTVMWLIFCHFIRYHLLLD